MIPQDRVIGLLGDSFTNKQHPFLPDLAGGSYLDLQTALRLRRNRVVCTGQAGAFSFDIPEQGWDGYATQLQKLIDRAVWFDGVPRLDTVIISTMNDCLHSQTEYPYSEAAANTYIENARQAALKAISLGHKVIILKPIECINMGQAAQYYGLPYWISDADYELLKYAHNEAFSNMEGVLYIEAWKNAVTIDGLHPDEWSQKKAAKEIGKYL